MTCMTGHPLLGRVLPTFQHVPEYVSSAGPEVIELAASAGLELDQWQQASLTDALGERADGSWAAFEAAWVVARQNGKGGILEARTLGGLYVLNEQLIMYSAHEFKTAAEMFLRIEQLIMNTDDLRRRVKKVTRSHGEEGIELLTRQRLRFVARSTGSGRGFSGDCNIWDESQNLSNSSVDALMPTMSARPNPQLLYAGSAPDRDLAPCDQISRVRRRAQSGGRGARRLYYAEWAAELHHEKCAKACTEHDNPDDPEVWAKTNPAMGIRISQEHIETEQDSMSSRGFARERLSVGRWSVEAGGWEVISQVAWEATADAASVALDPIAFALAVSHDLTYTAIAACGRREDGLLHLEIVKYAPGSAWAVPWMKERMKKWKPCQVAIDPGGPSAALAADLKEAGIELQLIKTGDVKAAVGGLYTAVVKPPDAGDSWASTVRHIPHPSLTTALAGAGKRVVGDAWAFDRRGEVDISPIEAVHNARYAYLTRPVEEEVELWVDYS